MEGLTFDGGVIEIFCCRIFYTSHWVSVASVLPDALSFLVHLASITLDTVLACALVFNNELFSSGVVTFLLIILPAVVTAVFKPPTPPDTNDFRVLCSWVLQVMVEILSYPLIASVSLLKRVIWTASSVTAKKPHLPNESDDCLTKETHTYLFLQAYLHSAPQAILQMYLLILGVAKDGFTVGLHIASVLVSVAIVASHTTLYHRYEAQVEGGRPRVLLTRLPQLTDDPDTARPLLPIKFCLRNRIISLEMDCQMGKLIAFSSWFFLIFGRILCLVISFKTHQSVLIVFLLVHFSLMLLYLLSSQSITFSELPSRLFNVTTSLIVLVEVSVRFFKIPLLYTFFFICLFVEDTFLMILFFVYPLKPLCTMDNLDCKYFGLCSYLIINSHVTGTILFGLYLAKYRPRKQTVVPSASAITIVSI